MRKLYLCVLTILLLYTSVYSDDKGGLSFLRIGVGGRATGLGEAFTTLAKGPSATFWNPAGLFSDTKYGIMAAHTEWFEDVTLDFASFKWDNKKTAFGISIYNSNVGGIEHRTGPTPTPEGIVNAHDLSAGFSFARKFSDRLTFGASAKYIQQKIFIESAAGFGFDLGCLYSANIEGLVLGASVRNLGKMNALKEEETNMPLLIRGGANYTPAALSTERYNVVLAVDYEYSNSGNNHLLVGTEIKIGTQLSLRGGYQSGYDVRNFTGGMGLSFSQFTFNYGYTPFTEDFGASHRLSAEFSW